MKLRSKRPHLLAALLALLMTLTLCVPMAGALTIVVPDKQTAKPTATPAPTGDADSDTGAADATAKPTAATGAALADGEEEAEYRYAKTNIKGVNIRVRANATAAVLDKIPYTGTPVLILEDATDSKDVAWYEIIHDETQGFIRADLLELITKEDYVALLAGETEKKDKD